MDEQPKSIWKKSWRGAGSSLLFLLLLGLGALIVVAVIGKMCGLGFDAVPLVGACFGIGLLVWALFRSVRWLCCWRNIKRTLFALACLATLIALFYAEENWRGQRAWEQFKREWKSQRIDLEWANNIPAKVPDEQNFALTPIVSSCYETYFDKQGHEVKPRNTNVVDRFTMLGWRDLTYDRTEVPESAGWQAGEKLNLKAWQAYFRAPPPDAGKTNCFPTTPQPQMPEDDVLLALSKYNSALEEIRQARRLSESRFPLTYDSADVASILLPHLSALKNTVKAIRLKSAAELQKNQSDAAFEDVRLCLGLVDALRTEPFLISQTVRKVMLLETLQPIWEGLAEHRWSEPQLIRLEAELARLDLLADCRRSQISEMAAMGKSAEYFSHHRNYVGWFAQVGFHIPNEKRLKMYLCRYMPEGWFYQGAVKSAQSGLQYLRAVDCEKQMVSPAMIQKEAGLTSHPASYFDPVAIFRDSFSSDVFYMNKFICAIASAEAAVNLARTAIALERHRLARGEFPETLAALEPQFIAQVPHDVIAGGQLKYRREANGSFTLYSIGWNERDDGGVTSYRKDSSFPDFESGDWVWRYPKKE